eukprot:3687121-Prymnesium_polylepis.1
MALEPELRNELRELSELAGSPAPRDGDYDSGLDKTMEWPVIALMGLLASVSHTSPGRVGESTNTFVAGLVGPLVDGTLEHKAVAPDSLSTEQAFEKLRRQALLGTKVKEQDVLLVAAARAGNTGLIEALVPQLSVDQTRSTDLRVRLEQVSNKQCLQQLREIMPGWQTYEVDNNLRERVLQATVRIGIYDKRTKRFSGLGSGTLVSEDGHILTAAHNFLGPARNLSNPQIRRMSVIFGDSKTGYPRFGSPTDELSDIEHLVIAIGVYSGEAQPSEWKYYARMVTPPIVLKERKKMYGLMDLAVLKLEGTLTMDPPAYTPYSEDNTPIREYSIVAQKASTSWT